MYIYILVLLNGDVYIFLIDQEILHYINVKSIFNIFLPLKFLQGVILLFVVNKIATDVSDEHGERFCRDISIVERYYRGKWS